MPDDLNFKDDLFSFYRFTTPVDLLGQVRIQEKPGAAEGDKAASKKNLPLDASQLLMNYFVNGNVSAKISVLNPKSGEAKSNDANQLKPQQIKSILDYCKRGFYKAAFQACGSSAVEYAIQNDIYFTAPVEKKKGDKTDPAPRLITNFYANVVGGQPGFDGNTAPEIDMAVILLRAPMLTSARRNVREIELYLNSMPPTFANALVPYCDVEFQLPILNLKNDPASEYVNRPSLYRFLMGSGQPMMSLTEADKALAYQLIPNTKEVRALQKQQSDGKDVAKNEAKINQSKSAFFGMEMFTSPQTLTNMNTLKSGKITGGGVRLNDAKPFLPPASIQSIGITVKNAGAHTFGQRNASIAMVIHDKARLVEFAEFIRGQAGYNEATIWITYGMLAPRNRGPNDAYAKFINENMLVREAYTVSNIQYSFNSDGSIGVSLTLGLKTIKHLSMSTITFKGVFEAQENLKKLILKVQKAQASLGDAERSEKNGFSQSEIRFAQVVQAAANGSLESGLEKKELSKVFDDVEKVLKDYKNSKSFKYFDPVEALKLVGTLKEYYGYIAQNQNKGTESPKERLKKAGVDFAKNKLEAASDRTKSPDPFFPTADKNKPPDVTIFTDDFINCCQPPKKPTSKNRYVSFGKLFSLFCVESLINGIAQEFNWSKSQLKGECPFETQFIFYQLNRKCGPASGHNIAEFPMDITMFTDAFGKYAEGIGGDDVTIGGFIDFLNLQFSDVRQPGYGRRDFYKEFDAEKPSAALGKEGSKGIEAWHKQYGSSFVIPQLNIDMEVGESNSSPTKVDLLSSLGNRIGGGFTDPAYKTSGKKTIVKFHIYDTTASPYEKLSQQIRKGTDGNIYAFDTEDLADTYTKSAESPSTPTARDTSTTPRIDVDGDSIKVAGTVVAVNLGTGKNALKNLLHAIVPVINIGSEGTLISNVSLQSKTDGLQGTIAMQGGTQRAENSLTSTGLSQDGIASPMIVYPAQLTMTTRGCPIAQPYQQYFFDFGTNTTIDNLYTVTQIQHSFGPGKFETQWTFGYTDGYPQFINPGKIDDLLIAVKKLASPPEVLEQGSGPARSAVT